MFLFTIETARENMQNEYKNNVFGAYASFAIRFES